MAARANPTVVGAFVLGGIVLFVAALFLFGGRDLFREKTRWVTYFHGSVEGLAVGAPVTFRGVRIGTVSAVKLVVDVKRLRARIPVYLDIDRDLITWAGGNHKPRPMDVVRAGIRAKLAMQSLVTGQMSVELDMLPGTPAHLVGADTSVPEVPSVPSDVAVLKEKLTKMPIEQVVRHVDQLAVSVNALVTSPDVRNSLDALNTTLANAQALMAQLGVTVIPLVRQATASLRMLSAEGHATMGDLRGSLKTADSALRQARTTLTSINGLVAADTQPRADIDTILANLSRASESLRSFADTLDRNPNALIVGR